MLKVRKFTVNPLQENCYVASDDTLECVIIDCGAYSSTERETVINYIKDNHLRPTHCLLTHYHTDHCIGCDTICETFGLNMEVHVAEKPLVEKRNEMCEFIFGEPLSETFPAVMKYFSSGEIISFGNHSLAVIHTPGHSPGSVVFYSEEESLAFSGDTLFKGSAGRTDFIGGSMFQIIQSLRMLCQLPDNTKLYPGHGDDTTMGYECATNPFIER